MKKLENKIPIPKIDFKYKTKQQIRKQNKNSKNTTAIQTNQKSWYLLFCLVICYFVLHFSTTIILFVILIHKKKPMREEQTL